tara:strand:- start:194 stop:1123 length:930 start_codon:yes stop_codon:yes gene_type:complete
LIEKDDNFRKTLVTGGTGYIGTRLINFFIKKEHSFIVLTNSAKILKKNYIFLKDINQIPSKAFEGVDRVVHLAGISRDIDSCNEEIEKKYFEANVHFVENILNKAIEEKVKSFVFISSTKAGYSNLNLSKVNNLSEDQPSIYALTKREAEKKVLEISSDKNIKVNIIRPSLVFGPETKGNLRLLKNLIKIGIKLKFYSLKNRKSLVHVDDVVHAINFLSLNGTGGEIYNVCGNNYDLNEISEIISKIYANKYITIGIPKAILEGISKLSFSKKYFFEKLKREEIYSSKKIKNLGFSFSKTLRNIDKSDY